MTVAAVEVYRRYIAQYHLYTFSALRATLNYRPLVRKNGTMAIFRVEEEQVP